MLLFVYIVITINFFMENYIEYVFTNGASAASVDVGKAKFLQLLDFCKGLQGTKYFNKESIRYFYDDLVYEIVNNTEVKTYRKVGLNATTHDTYTVLKFKKEKIPYFQFPSTTSINNVQYVSSAIIRFHNNIYMNFEVIEYKDKTVSPTYKAFLNYNHESNIDPVFIQAKLRDIEKAVNGSGIHRITFDV